MSSEVDESRHRHIGETFKTFISGGWAAHDPDILADLVQRGADVAKLVVDDAGASEETAGAARRFLADVSEEFGPAGSSD